MKLILNLRGHGHAEIEVRDRSTSRLLRFAPWANGAWTTVNGVVYPPTVLSAESVAAQINRFESVLAHEWVHVKQQRAMSWVLFAVAYALLPVPFLAPMRAWLEAQAYAHECVHYGRAVEKCVDAICSGLYGWPVPKFVALWMMRRAVARAATA